jgi:hypothetical protein
MQYENLFKIHIPEPCHEDWDKMTSNEQGAFCKVCAKTVVDFSVKTNDEIQNYLLQNEGKNVCGRFLSSQLEEPKNLKIELPGYLFPLSYSPIRSFALALFVAASLSLAGCGSAENEVTRDKIGKLTYQVQGGFEIKPDSTTKIRTELPADTVLTSDTAQPKLLMGGVEPKIDTNKTTNTNHIKMGMIKKTPEKKEYLKGEVQLKK